MQPFLAVGLANSQSNAKISFLFFFSLNFKFFTTIYLNMEEKQL